VVTFALDLRIEMTEKAYLALIAEANHIALRQLLCRLDQRLPARAVEPLDQRRLDLRFGAAADASPVKLGRDDFGVVHHHLVAGFEPLRKIADHAVTQDAIGL